MSESTMETVNRFRKALRLIQAIHVLGYTSETLDEQAWANVLKKNGSAIKSASENTRALVKEVLRTEEANAAIRSERGW